MNFQKIKAVIFDVDGVLINSKDIEGQYLWCRDLTKDFNISIHSLKHLFNEGWDQLSVGIGDTKKHVDQFLKTVGSEISSNEFISYWHKKDSDIDEDIIEMCRALKKNHLNLYLGTIQEKYRANYLWNELGFNLLFEENFSSCFIGYKKPDEKFYKTVEEKLGLLPSEIIFLDDDKKNVISALNVGWKAYHYTNFQKAKTDIFEPLLGLKP